MACRNSQTENTMPMDSRTRLKHCEIVKPVPNWPNSSPRRTSSRNLVTGYTTSATATVCPGRGLLRKIVEVTRQRTSPLNEL